MEIENSTRFRRGIIDNYEIISDLCSETSDILKLDFDIDKAFSFCLILNE